MRIIISLIFVMILSICPAIKANAGFDPIREGMEHFHQAMIEHFKVPPFELLRMEKQRINPVEMPIVLLLAAQAHVASQRITSLRLQGLSWLDITLRLGLKPDIFFVPVKKVKGPPYGKAYGYYKNRGGKNGKVMPLNDDDILNLVNLKFMSEHYRMSPDEIINMRSSGKNFIDINREIKKGKSKKYSSNGKNKQNKSESKSKGKNK